MGMDLGSMFNIGRQVFQDINTLSQQHEARSQQQHSEDLALTARLEDYERAKEFAKMGIQWRTEDARAAGLHPLSVLGATGPSFASSGISVGQFQGPPMLPGQDFSRAARATMTPEQRELHDLQVANLKSMIAQRDIASMDQLDSIISRQGAGMSGVSNSGIPSAVTNPDFYAGPQNPDVRRAGVGVVQVNPSVTESHASGDESLAAARHVTLAEFRLPTRDGRMGSIFLPNATSTSEALESLSESPLLLYATIAENSRRNPNFASDYAHLLPGGELIWGLRDAMTELLSQVAFHNRTRPMPPAVRERAFPRDVEVIRR